MPSAHQDANIREKRRRKTPNKTAATPPALSPAPAPAKTTRLNSAKTITTRPTVKTISKKKKVNKRQGKWRITPANKANDSDSGSNTAKTHATSLAKNTFAKYSTKTHAKILWKAFNNPATTLLNFRAKSSYKICEKRNPLAARKFATKMASSANVEVQCADNATVSVMGLLFDGLGVLTRKRPNTIDLSRQKDLFKSTTSGDIKEGEDVTVVKKQTFCIQDKDRSVGTTIITDDVKDAENEAKSGKEVCESKSSASKANQEDLTIKKKKKKKEKKKLKQNLSRISAFEYYNIANSQKKGVANKKQNTSWQVKGRTDPTITNINDTNEDVKEVKKIDENKRHALKNVLKEIKKKKVEKNKLKKKQQLKDASIQIDVNVPNYDTSKKQNSFMQTKDRPLIVTSKTINEAQNQANEAKEVLEKKSDKVKFNKEVKLNQKEKKKAKRKKQQQQRAAKRELGKKTTKGRLEKDSSVNFYNPDGSKSKMKAIEKSKKMQSG